MQVPVQVYTITGSLVRFVFAWQVPHVRLQFAVLEYSE